MTSSNPVNTVPFRKKKGKDSSQRSRKVDSTGSDDSGEDIKQDDLELIKLQQILRGKNKKYFSVTSNQTNLGQSGNAAKSSNLQSTLGAQFSVQVDDGYGATGSINHEKLMHQYIDEKLGVSKVEVVIEKPAYVLEQEKLYKVPDYIKVTSQQSIRKEEINDGDINGIKSAWSTGIAEVALPLSYKLRNIEETERLLKLKESTNNVSNPEVTIPTTSNDIMDMSSKSMTSNSSIILPESSTSIATNWTQRPAYYQRFQRTEAPSLLHGNEANELLLHIDHQHTGAAINEQPVANPTPIITTLSSSQSNAVIGLKRSQQSSDDYTMDKYRKQHMQYRKR
mmetsp:Transcript_31959/g.46022  ORF Transcript_31959/g.46022 Transcript_31959/m.46022 type:complete len:338 (+) Transcript_31959:3-1016(+)